MVAARREVRTRLSADDAWARLTTFVGDEHWGAARRTFVLVDGDGGRGSTLRSSTFVDDEVVVTDVAVVRHERTGGDGVVVLHGDHELGSATETLTMVTAAHADEVVVVLELTYSVGVDLGPMRLWVGRFADDLRTGLAAALEVGAPNTT